MLTAYDDMISMFNEKYKSNLFKKSSWSDLRVFRNKINEHSEYSRLFSPTKERVLKKILSSTKDTGISVLSGNLLSEKCNVSTSTVYKTVINLKKTNTFIVGRIANERAGNYIFVNKSHPHCQNILREVFKLENNEIIDLIN